MTSIGISAPAGDVTAVITPSVEPLRRKRPYLVYAGAFWLALVILCALLAPILPIGPYGEAVGPPKQGPFGGGGLDMLLGSDSIGRSMLSRVVYGARASLLVGVIAGTAGLLIGLVLGLIGGYFRGKVDSVVTILADAMLAFPPLVLLMALSAALTPSIGTLLFGLTFIVAPAFTRVARANTMTWASREFVLAARNMGAGHFRVITREILPNVIAPLLTFVPIVVSALIVAEGSLSFLGLGIPPPTPSWGGMISAGQNSLEQYPYLVLVPAAIIFLTVLSLNLLGDHLRARFDDTVRD
jgi:peptide/nickel transport system permease protein